MAVSDRQKLAFSIATFVVACVIGVGFGGPDAMGIVVMALVSLAAYLFYDAISSMRVLARRRARARAKIPEVRVIR